MQGLTEVSREESVAKNNSTDQKRSALEKILILSLPEHCNGLSKAFVTNGEGGKGGGGLAVKDPVSG
jgi:hypothetical protein